MLLELSILIPLGVLRLDDSNVEAIVEPEVPAAPMNTDTIPSGVIF